MVKKYKPIRLKPEFDENPFIEKAIENINTVRKTQIVRTTDKNEIQMIVSQSGEVEGHTAFVRYIEVDEEKFAKVYLSQFSSFWELGKPSIRVFGYILRQLKPNSDRFYFDMDECKMQTGYKTDKSVLDGLVNLIDCGIIARSNKHYVYFINPLVVFNGNRITFAKTYVRKKKGIDENQLELFDKELPRIE